MNEEKHFFEVFKHLLQKSLFLYQIYSINQKQFLFALAIKRNNIKINRLILKNIDLFQEKQRIELISIVNHIECWLTQWNNHYKKLNPRLEECFDFQTVIKFPKQNIANLEEYFYLKYGEKIDAI